MERQHPSFYIELAPWPEQADLIESSFVLRAQSLQTPLTAFASPYSILRFTYLEGRASAWPIISMTPPTTEPSPLRAPPSGWVFGVRVRSLVSSNLLLDAQQTLEPVVRAHRHIIEQLPPLTEFETQLQAATAELFRLLQVTAEPSKPDQARVSQRSQRRQYRAQKGLAAQRIHTLSRFQSTLAPLAKRQQSLSDLAYASGYTDQSHFSREFKKHTGQSPRQFLQQWPEQSVQFIQEIKPESSIRLAISLT